MCFMWHRGIVTKFPELLPYIHSYVHAHTCRYVYVYIHICSCAYFCTYMYMLYKNGDVWHQLNLGLNVAWRKTQNGDDWQLFVKTAILQSGEYHLRWWWWCTSRKSPNWFYAAFVKLWTQMCCKHLSLAI